MKEKLDSLIGIAGVPYETAGLFYLLAVIGMWRIFKKAGEAGWKALIPVWNIYVLYKISWNGGAFWRFALMGILSAGLETISRGFTHKWMALPLLLIALAAAVWSLILQVKMNLHLARSFGYGTVMGLVVLLLPFIGTLILGFDSNRYRGPIRG